ncbi:MAG: DUF2076 domain-containing protein [Bradyrhizobium sp.]|uniref:DUF2076 domain-containing protein n=1 Tax=Bradyrhizobium sp. TaxID=376 RepID=UPI0025C3EE91|nr:DUF2076 domain-containing protein [Bradyrhizobium sp.]MBI5261156.1 DUF2076 domain-containing protein [Bradyrhizobium sp.]
MTPQERQLVDELFDRLSRLENAPRDPDAAAAISDGLRKAPGAVYALVQTVLLQDEALRRANSRIEQLEAATQAPEQGQSGGFLDSMRETLFGSNQPRGSVPNVRPPENRPVWNSGQAMQQAQSPGYGQGYGQGQAGQGAPPFGGGGGSFLGTAAAAAAGVVGGSLLLGSIRSMMGGQQHGFGDASAMGDRGASPWAGDQSKGTLAHDAGVDDIGSNRDQGGDTRQGLFDLASNKDDPSSSGDDDSDQMDMDSDDGFDNDGGSDYA